MAAPVTTKLTPPIVQFGQPLAEFNENGYRNIQELNGVLSSIDNSAGWIDVRAGDAEGSAAAAQESEAGAAEQAGLAQQAKSGAQQAQQASEQARDDSEAIKQSNEAIAASVQSSAGMPALTAFGDTLTIIDIGGGEKGVGFRSPGSARYSEITASGNFTPLPTSKFLYVECVGGGASGTFGTSTTHFGGRGGDFAFGLFKAEDLPASVVVTVGLGGAAITSSTTPTGGNAGGDSSFGGLVYAYGGRGADSITRLATHKLCAVADQNISSWSADLQSMLFTFCVTPTFEGGFGGGLTRAASNSLYGGAGGGTSSSAAGTSANSGDGGAGAQNANGVDGGFPGGGGGSVYRSSGGPYTTGAGGDGVVRVWEW